MTSDFVIMEIHSGGHRESGGIGRRLTRIAADQKIWNLRYPRASAANSCFPLCPLWSTALSRHARTAAFHQLFNFAQRGHRRVARSGHRQRAMRSEEHTSELQS